MAILENEIWITLNNNHKYYMNLGYEIPKDEESKGKYKAKKGTKLLIKVSDLPKSSNFEVTKICDQCRKTVGNVPYFAILKQRKNNEGKDLCKTCSRRNFEIGKAKNNSLKTSFRSLSEEWLRCLEDGCDYYTPDMVSVKSNYSVLWKCSKENCEYEWIAKISDRTNGSGCPSCWGRVVSDKNRLSILFPELVADWHPTYNEPLTPKDVTYSSHIEIWWKCKDGHKWKTPVHSRTVMKSGCPECAETKGEKRVRFWLSENNVKFEPQKEFDNLIGTGEGKLSYDFFASEINMLIEYQGEFHDGSARQQTEKELIIQKEHDKRKRNYAEKNGIQLLEIWYWDYDNIEKILNEKLIKGGMVIDKKS